MKIISVNKLFVGILTVSSLLVAPSTAQIPAGFTPLFTFVIGGAGFAFDAVNAVTGLVGIPKITIQGIFSALLAIAAPDIESEVLDGICTPLNEVLGDVGVCTCALVEGAASTALTVGISCVPAENTADYCFDTPDNLVCGPLEVSGEVVVPLTEAGLAIINNEEIEVKAVPTICINMVTPTTTPDELICATGEVVQSISLSDDSDFDPASIVVTDPSVTILKENTEEAVECDNVTVGECDSENVLSYGFNCAAQSDKLTSLQCLSLSSS